MEKIDCDLLVIGGGPGGYSAAFRAADLGLRVVIAEQRDALGGVCLNVGCIPSKTYLHQAAIIREVKEAAQSGVQFADPVIDLDAIRSHKQGIVKKLSGGLSGLAKARKVSVLTGVAQLSSQSSAQLITPNGETKIVFKYCLLAVGSEIMRLPFLPDDPRILDSTSALELPADKGTMLIIGGGVIGLEMATIYSSLGMHVDIVELTGDLIPGADQDLVAIWRKRNQKWLGEIMLNTKVVEVKSLPSGLEVTFDQAPRVRSYDFILSAAGRVANGHTVNGEVVGLSIDERGFVSVDSQMRTSVNNIFAVGDVVGSPMLAHKAVHQGHVAAEVISGEITEDPKLSRMAFDTHVIPSVAYTNPEIAWVGLTETEARISGIEVKVARFPWAASGRALVNGCDYGLTKLLTDPATNQIVGGAIVGPNAGDMISEIGLAIEMCTEATDLALTIHPHPTLGETIGLAGAVALGTCTDLPAPQ